MNIDTNNLGSLSIETRLNLIEVIWNSLDSSREALLLTPAQEEELDRRLAIHENSPESGVPMEEALARLRNAL